MHPYLTQQGLLAYCKLQNIAVTAYSSFGGGSYVEMGKAQEADACWTEQLAKDYGTKYNKTPAQIILRWAVQRGTAVIPKSSKPERMDENFALLDFTLTADEMTALDNLNKNRRFNDPSMPPFNLHIFD